MPIHIFKNFFSMTFFSHVTIIIDSIGPLRVYTVYMPLLRGVKTNWVYKLTLLKWPLLFEYVYIAAMLTCTIGS